VGGVAKEKEEKKRKDGEKQAIVNDVLPLY
jgi:hypothetical protein